SMRRSGSKHIRFRIILLFLRHRAQGIVFSPAACMHKDQVADLHVFNGMPGNSRQNQTHARRIRRTDRGNVAQNHPPDRAYCNARRRILAPSRTKIGASTVSRMLIFVHVTSSITAPSTLSMLNPRQPSKTQLETVMFLKPPLDSVPNLIRPVRGTFASSANFLKLPSSSAPSSKLPLNMQFVMVTISVVRAYPSANELFRQIPSSHGEFTPQFEIRTLRQQSTSIPSRLVSIFRLSIVRLSTPVARIPKCPPCKIEKSRSSTFRQFLSAMALLATPACSATGPAPHP